MNYSIDTPISI